MAQPALPGGMRETRSRHAFWQKEREVFLAFFASRLFLWVAGWLAFHLIKHGEYQVFPAFPPWLLLYRWDAF